jgi:hypothetical protein
MNLKWSISWNKLFYVRGSAKHLYEAKEFRNHFFFCPKGLFHKRRKRLRNTNSCREFPSKITNTIVFLFLNFFIFLFFQFLPRSRTTWAVATKSERRAATWPWSVSRPEVLSPQSTGRGRTGSLSASTRSATIQVSWNFTQDKYFWSLWSQSQVTFVFQVCFQIY